MGNIVIFIEYEKYTFKIKTSSQKTVNQLKRKIYKKIGIKESSKLLLFKERELINSNVLSFYGINNNSKIKLKKTSNNIYKEQENSINNKFGKETTKGEIEETKNAKIDNVTKGKFEEVTKGEKEEITIKGKKDELTKGETKEEEKDETEKTTKGETKEETISSKIIEKYKKWSYKFEEFFKFNINLTHNYNYDLTIGQLKQKICKEYHIPLHRQQLLLGWIELLDDNIKIIDIDFWNLKFCRNENTKESDFVNIKVNDHSYNKIINVKVDLYWDLAGQIYKAVNESILILLLYILVYTQIMNIWYIFIIIKERILFFIYIEQRAIDQ